MARGGNYKQPDPEWGTDKDGFGPGGEKEGETQETLNQLSSMAFAYALAAQISLRKEWGAGSAPDTFTPVKVLHRGCANEAAYWTFETSTGERYAVEVQRVHLP